MFEFLQYFKICIYLLIYLFIPRFMEKLLTMFCGTLVGKHLYKQSKKTLHASKLVAASSSEMTITVNPSSFPGRF